MYHHTDRVLYTNDFVTPVVEHWLEREIAMQFLIIILLQIKVLQCTIYALIYLSKQYSNNGNAMYFYLYGV